MHYLTNTLKDTDPELHNLINEEKKRQYIGFELIASENFTSQAVMDCLGSCLTNKYSEGQVGKRYYGGNNVIDKIEFLCIKRALEAYRLDPEEWGVNVQPYSGSTANFAAYMGLINKDDKIMGLSLPSGGHLTHGYETPKKKISITSVVFNSQQYEINENGYIDYNKLREQVIEFKPKLIICGASAYPRDYDYKKFRKIADINDGTVLLCDMAHFSGFVAAQEHNNPFDYCDVVTTTTHKTMGGPRSGMIFFKKEYGDKINFSVFPSTIGGPHNHQIAAVATQLKYVNTEEYVEYIKQIKRNTQTLVRKFKEYGYKMSTDGSDNHLILLNVRKLGLSGSKVEKICERVDISINKNTIYGDKSAMSPGGIRIGTSALTTRGFKENDFEYVDKCLNRCIELCLEIQNKSGKLLKNFIKEMENHSIELDLIKKNINNYAKSFPFYDT